MFISQYWLQPKVYIISRKWQKTFRLVDAKFKSWYWLQPKVYIISRKWQKTFRLIDTKFKSQYWLQPNRCGIQWPAKFDLKVGRYLVHILVLASTYSMQILADTNLCDNWTVDFTTGSTSDYYYQVLCL